MLLYCVFHDLRNCYISRTIPRNYVKLHMPIERWKIGSNSRLVYIDQKESAAMMFYHNFWKVFISKMHARNFIKVYIQLDFNVNWYWLDFYDFRDSYWLRNNTQNFIKLHRNCWVSYTWHKLFLIAFWCTA